VLLAAEATSGSAQNKCRKNPFQAMEDAFADLLNRGMDDGFQSQPTNPDEAFFIQVDVDKTEAFVGQQITVSWYLYTIGQNSRHRHAKVPKSQWLLERRDSTCNSAQLSARNHKWHSLPESTTGIICTVSDQRGYCQN
jgi:hypothetical protein